MEVILLEKIRNLGELGDKVNVKSGYGRNFLIPYNKAIIANQDNLAEFEARRVELEKMAKENLAAAESRAASLAELSVTITAKAGDEGKLYGSVNVKEIADAITETGVAVEKSEVILDHGAIRNTGEYDIRIQLHTDVEATIKLTIVEE